MNKLIVYSFFFCASIVSAAYGQKDTARKQSIDITSSYKPVLRNAVKVNFSATQIEADTNRTVQPYTVPQQNLYYAYQAIALRPLALQTDTLPELGGRNYVKAGFGNYATPYVKAGIGFGNGKDYLINVYADYLSSKGNIKNQNQSAFNVNVAGSYFTPKNEVFGGAAVSQQEYYLYGYDHNLFTYDKTSLQQKMQQVNLYAGIRNKNKTGTGINYAPRVDVNIVNFLDKARENSLKIEAPFTKTFNDQFTVKLGGLVDITSYETKSLFPNVKFNNNVLAIAPAIEYAKPMLTIHAGLSPTWDNGKLVAMPDIYAEAGIKQDKLMAMAGITGRVIKNNLQHLFAMNPWLRVPDFQINTHEVEIFAGIKSTVGKHFNFNAKAGFVSYTNLPLFINDTSSDGKTFLVVNETKINNLRLHADASFINQDEFTVNAGATLNIYNGLKINERAWGTIPMEITASMRWWAFKQLLLKSDFKMFAGSPVLLKNNQDKNLAGGIDLSAGLEYRINNRFSAWLDLNNVFNNKYQRWNQYEVYGLHVMGGVIVRF